MRSSLIDWLPVLPAVAALGIALLALLFVRVRERGARRDSPFADDFTRAPGHKLRGGTEAAYRWLWRAILLAVMWPLLVYAAWAGLHIELGLPRSPLVDLGCSAVLVLGIAWALARVFRAERRFRHLRLALDAEISVGQLLSKLLGQGSRLVHDVGVPGGRIAHVLVMPSGVHAIRTVARLRRGRGHGRDDVTVRCEGADLFLPGGADMTSVPLARKQAQLLADRLRQELGYGVRVRAAVALPGWRVEQQAGTDVTVFNPREGSGMLAGPQVLNAAQIEAITGVLEAMIPAAARPAKPKDHAVQRKEPRLE